MKDFSHHSNEKALVDLNQAIENTLMITRNSWRLIADVEMDIDTELPLVNCCGSEIKQVLLNLVVNAAHAMEEQADGERGKLAITSRQSDGIAEIRVADSGCGIPQAARDKVFDPFFTTKEVGKGTGQGLSISYDIITNKHGGCLFFETEEGVGTTFVIQLPTGKGLENEEPKKTKVAG